MMNGDEIEDATRENAMKMGMGIAWISNWQMGGQACHLVKDVRLLDNNGKLSRHLPQKQERLQHQRQIGPLASQMPKRVIANFNLLTTQLQLNCRSLWSALVAGGILLPPGRESLSCFKIVIWLNWIFVLVKSNASSPSSRHTTSSIHQRHPNELGTTSVSGSVWLLCLLRPPLPTFRNAWWWCH